MTDKTKNQDKSIAKEILDRVKNLTEAVDGAGDLRVGAKKTSNNKNEGGSGATDENTTNKNDDVPNKSKE